MQEPSKFNINIVIVCQDLPATNYCFYVVSENPSVTSDLASHVILVLHITALILPLNVLPPLAVTCVSAPFHITTTLSHRVETQQMQWRANEVMLRFLLTHAVKKKSHVQLNFFPLWNNHHEEPRVHRKVHREIQATKYKSGSTGWQAVAPWEVNEECDDICTCNIWNSSSAGGGTLMICYIRAELYINKALAWLRLHLSGVQVTADIKYTPTKNVNLCMQPICVGRTKPGVSGHNS